MRSNLGVWITQCIRRACQDGNRRLKGYLQFIYQISRVKAAVWSVLILVFTWIIGPYMTFVDYAPFADPAVKMVITSIVVCFCLLRLLPCLFSFFHRIIHRIYYFKNKRILQKSEKKVLQYFALELKQHLQSLHMGWRYPFFIADKRPWIVVLGRCDTGKSALLQASGYHLKKTVMSYSRIVRWENDQIVFFELPSEYIQNDNVLLNLQWQTFLSLMRRLHRNKFLNGVLFAVDVPYFTQMHADHEKEFSIVARKRLHSLSVQGMNVPVSVVLTKCDLLTGFIPFFSELNQKERHQFMGIEFCNGDAKHPFHIQFVEQYEQLMQKMNNRLIWLLHHEPNLAKKQAMQSFIVELEIIEGMLGKCFTDIGDRGCSLIRNLALTSSRQRAASSAVSLTQQLHVLPVCIKERKEAKKNIISHPFFVRELFSQLPNLLYTNNHYQCYIVLNRLLFAVEAFGLVLLVVVWMQLGYEAVCGRFISMNRFLYTKPLAEQTVSKKWENRLDAWLNIKQYIDQKTPFHWYWFAGSRLAAARAQGNALYEKGLRQFFIPALERTLMSTIKQGSKTNRADVYFSLKAYLMLGDSQHLNKDFIRQWFLNHWSIQYAGQFEQQNSLTKHLEYVLNSELLPISLNTSVIQTARQSIRRFPLANLSFLVLADHYLTASPVLLFQGEKDIDGFELTRLSISSFYDPKKFKIIYNKKIPEFVKTGAVENWVTGKIKQAYLKPTQRLALINDVRRLYLASYSQNWLSVLNQIRFVPAKSFTALKKEVDLLMNHDSPFWQFIHVILFNAALSGNSDMLSVGFKDEYKNLSTLMVTSGDAYHNMQAMLTSFDQYLLKIIHSPDLQQTSYGLASNRMHQGSPDILTRMHTGIKKLPRAFDRIFYDWSLQAFGLMLYHASHYIDQQWKASVWQSYRDIVDQHYPVFTQSTQDTALNHFKLFFAPEGTMDKFFNRYIRPFVDTRQDYWTFKKKEALSLPMPQASLDIFIRAALIKKMFFTKDPEKVSFQFSLLPMALSPDLKACTIKIGGQVMVIQPDNFAAHVFSWSNMSNHPVSVMFTSKAKQDASIRQQGDWGWFRLLDASSVRTTSSPREYTVIFQSGQHYLQLMLTTPNLINPFVPNILHTFRCTSSLLEKN
jgi:type VI protein secretion system component VasK